VRLLLAAALLSTALAASPAWAEGDQIFDLGQKATLPNDMTWRDVLRLVFPDLRQEPREDGKTGDFIHGDVSLRPIGKQAFNDDCEVDPLRIEYIETARVEISGKMRVIVGITTEGDACFGALALFDGGKDTKLLDAVNIQQDQNYGYGNGFARSLGPDGELIVADSFHTTTSSSPDNYVLVLVTADKLSLVGNVDARSEWDCDDHRSIAENPYVVVTPDYGAFDRITGYIKRTVQPVGDDCRTPTGNPKVTITRTDWRWDPVKKAYR
jgi:hypothetical protein